MEAIQDSLHQKLREVLSIYESPDGNNRLFNAENVDVPEDNRCNVLQALSNSYIRRVTESLARDHRLHINGSD